MGPHTAMSMKQDYRKQQCGVVWCGVVWCGVVWCGVACRGSLYECVHCLMRWQQGGRREEMKQVRKVREDGRKGKLERKEVKKGKVW